LYPLLEDRGHITESIRILVPVDRMKQKCFHITTKRVCRSQQFQLRRTVGSLFHAHDAATEKALSPIVRHDRDTTRLPHDEACGVDRPGILATDVLTSVRHASCHMHTRDFVVLQVHFLLVDSLNHTSVKVSADLFPDVHSARVTSE